MARFLEETGANPGRSGHRLSVDAARLVFETRERVARLFNAPDPLRVTFALRYVHLVGPHWIVKTSSGKTARSANRDKFLTEMQNTGQVY